MTAGELLVIRQKIHHTLGSAVHEDFAEAADQLGVVLAESLKAIQVQLPAVAAESLRVPLRRLHAAQLQQALKRVRLVADTKLVPIVKAAHRAQLGAVAVAALALGN